MLKQYDVYWYRYIMKCEEFLLMRYKVDSVTMTKRMTMLELQTHIQGIYTQIEEDKKSGGENRIMKSLVAIRDILNFMTLKETK